MPDPKLAPLGGGGALYRAFLGQSTEMENEQQMTALMLFTEVGKCTVIMQENISFLRKFTLRSKVKFHGMYNLHLKTQDNKSHLCWLSKAERYHQKKLWTISCGTITIGPPSSSHSCFFIQSPQQPHESVSLLHFTKEKTEPLQGVKTEKELAPELGFESHSILLPRQDLPTKLCGPPSDIMTGRQEIWEQRHLWIKHGHLWKRQ